MMNYHCTIRYILLLLTGLLGACSDQFSGVLFKSQSPHERYQKQLSNAGLERSLLYRQWLQASMQSLTDPTMVTIPHQELAYIARDKPAAIGYSFTARQGERLLIDVSVNSKDTVQLFIDLFEASPDTVVNPKRLVSADTTTTLTWDVREDGQYLLRIQTELLAELSFRLQLTAEASLASPVIPSARQHIGSVFGDVRDGGRRKHEGIDIFAARRTPVIAATDGLVRVGNNRLGGKVVWLRTRNRPLNLYYAHLDSQLVVSGQSVSLGDTLGFIGNTGNAKTTPPHLHFGIYGRNGAIDPLPFLRPGKSEPPAISADTSRIGDTLRSTQPLLPGASRHIPALVEATYREGYRVILPDSSKHFVPQKRLQPLSRIRPLRLTDRRDLYAQPDTTAARITELEAGQQTQIIAEYLDFFLVEGPVRGWIRR